MSNEMFYIDENGKKQDAALHEEILREDDEEFNLAMSRMLLRQMKKSGSPGYASALERYVESVKRYREARHGGNKKA